MASYSVRLFNIENNSSSTTIETDVSLEEYIKALEEWKNDDNLVLLKTSFHDKTSI